MKQDRERIYNLEGIEIRVPLRYAGTVGKYLAEFPDLEEQPIYTATGYLCVEAVRDACAQGRSRDELEAPCIDCGSCIYYTVEQVGDLIGFCRQPTERKN